MGIFDFWKNKADLNNHLYTNEKLTSLKLYRFIEKIRKHLEEPVGYDDENSFGFVKENSSENMKKHSISIFEKYSDEQFSKHIKFVFEDGASKDERGQDVSYEDELNELSFELFSHCIKRANIKNHNSVLKSTKNILFNFCSAKSVVLNFQFTQNEMDRNVLKLIIGTTEELL